MHDRGETLNLERETAERELRRGNFKLALETYERLATENPEDESLARRLEDLRDLLQPMELTHPKAASTSESGGTTAVHEAEAAANRGDLPAALAGYRALVAENPDNELFRERLEELLAMAADPVMVGAMPRSRPSVMPQAPSFSPSPDPSMPMMPRSNVVAPLGAGISPIGDATGGDDLPDEPIALLEELLARLRTNRRSMDNR